MINTFNKRTLVSLAILFATLPVAATRAQDDEASLPLAVDQAARRSPAVASILATQRETPGDQLNAVFLLLDLGESDAARLLWQEFSANELDNPTEAALVKRFGVARFLSLSRRAAEYDLDGAREFAEGALKRAAELGRDPQQLAQLIKNLEDPADAVRRAARYDLSVTGTDGATACFAALAQAPTGDQGEQLRTQLLLTLANMRPLVEPMLVAAIADGEEQFRRDAVELSGYLHLQEAIPWLAALAAGADSNEQVQTAAAAALTKMGLSLPGSAEARAVVLSEISRLEAHQHPPEFSRWWTYQAKQIQGIEVSPKSCNLLSIARLARLLGKLPNASPDDRRLALVYAYRVAKLLDQPIDSETTQYAESLDIAQLNEALHASMKRDQVSAAISCAELLGKRADEAALVAYAGRPSPLAAALAHPSRELRFAALEAIMKMKPQRSFVGASGVVKTLWQFAGGSGELQIVVASSVAGKASQWAGMLRGLGYEATPVTSGRQALLAALNSPRLEFMLIDSDIGRPLLREVIYGLRSNPQLSHMPIAVLSSLDNLARAKQIAESDPWLLATPRPHSVESLETVLEELAAFGEHRAATDRRIEQAVSALGWIAELLEAGHPYDELLRDSGQLGQSLYRTELTESTLDVLAALGTAGSQQLLVDFASSTNQSIALRRLAGDAFAKSVQRYGKLLTSDSILRQYDRYNASESADQETQAVLGGLLDVLEEQK